MAAINKAALALTQCWACLGCNQLENPNFRGDNTCQNYRKADVDVLVARRYGKEKDEPEQTWRRNHVNECTLDGQEMD